MYELKQQSHTFVAIMNNITWLDLSPCKDGYVLAQFLGMQRGELPEWFKIKYNHCEMDEDRGYCFSLPIES
jgi:hypothetical protein